MEAVLFSAMVSKISRITVAESLLSFDDEMQGDFWHRFLWFLFMKISKEDRIRWLTFFDSDSNFLGKISRRESHFSRKNIQKT